MRNSIGLLGLTYPVWFMVSLILTVLFAGTWIGWVLKRAHVSDEAAKLIRELMGTVEAMGLQVEQLMASNDAAIARAQNEERRRVEVVECIVLIERDRDRWKAMYWDAGLGHSNAQALLMREITRLSGLVHRYDAKKSELSTGIQETVDNYAKNHRHTGSEIGQNKTSWIDTGIDRGSGSNVIASDPSASVGSVAK